MHRPAAPTPPHALLAPQPAPQCAFPPAESADERQKLDYEQQCYRQAETIVRERLHRLQAWVAANQHAH